MIRKFGGWLAWGAPCWLVGHAPGRAAHFDDVTKELVLDHETKCGVCEEILDG